jgi:hypothetical protein
VTEEEKVANPSEERLNALLSKPALAIDTAALTSLEVCVWSGGAEHAAAAFWSIYTPLVTLGAPLYLLGSP